MNLCLYQVAPISPLPEHLNFKDLDFNNLSSLGLLTAPLQQGSQLIAILFLFNISHLSSRLCSDTVAKRSQQDSRAEQVTATNDSIRHV